MISRDITSPVLEDGPSTLVANMMGMGDLIMMTPALRVLREALPNSRIGVICRAPFSEILEGNDAIDEVIPFSHTRIRFIRNRNARQLTRRLANTGYQRALFFDRYRGMPRWVHEAGVPAKQCFLRTTPEGHHTTLENDVALDHSSAVPTHISEQCRRFVARLTGSTACLGEPEVTVTDAHRETAATLLGSTTDPTSEYWVVHAGLSTTTRFRWPFETRGKIAHRAWPLESWAEFLATLLRPRACGIVLTGTAPETPIARELRRLLPADLRPRVHILAGRTRPMVLAAILEKARGYLGLDTGPMHLAAAVGTPVIALYGPTDPRVCGPIGPNGIRTTITEPVPCSPCRGETRRGCRDNICMKGITAARLLAAAEENGL